METLFNQFPLDIQVSILSYHPHFRCINKSLTVYGDYLFQEKYALNPITKGEFCELLKTMGKK